MLIYKDNSNLNYPPKELHVCMGLNSCENKGYSGNNSCAGQGDCATISHACHTLNDCKGQGGCGLFGTTTEFCTPGENSCKYQGSCGSPILASRYICQGPNKGRSVWQLARARFEERMQKEGKRIGKAPAGQEYGPTDEFVNTLRGTTGQDYSSCGQSGDRYCSYAFDPKVREQEREARRQQFMEESKQEMPNTLKTCDGRK